MITTINPFQDSRSANSRQTFTYHGRSLLCHRGVDVYKNDAGGFDYVFAGMTITQRAGFEKSRAMEIIDGMLDGNLDQLRPERVCAHLRSHGHKPMSYADAEACT